MAALLCALTRATLLTSDSVRYQPTSLTKSDCIARVRKWMMTEEKGFRFFAKGTDLIRMVRRVPFLVIQGSDDRGYEKHSITGCAKLTEFRTVRPLLEFVGRNTR